MQRWVKNLSGVPLTKAQASLLTHGPNFAVTPRHPPYGDYIAAIEQACLNLEPHKVKKSLGWKYRGALNHLHPPGTTSVRKKPRCTCRIRKRPDQGSS